MALRDRAAQARRLLDRYLFLEPAPAAPAGYRFSPWQLAVLVAALLALAVILQLARIGWDASLNSLWAEDGEVFLRDALSEGFGQTVGAEYSGYLVLVPRLIAEAATAFPLADAPVVFSVLAATVAGLSGLVVWYAASGYIADPYLRGALVLATVLTPVGGLETIDSAAYASWFMLFAVFWILLWRPRTMLGATLGGLFAAATVLSNPSAWFLLPLALLRALAVRDRRDATIAGAYFGASAIQLVAVARSSYDATGPIWSTSTIVKVALQRVVDGAAFGLELGGTLWAHLGWVFLIALTAALVLVFAYGLLRADIPARAFAAGALALAALMFVLSVYQRGVAPAMLWPPHAYGSQGGRYAIVPVLLVISAAMVLLEGWRRTQPERWRPWPGLALLALLLVSVGASYSATDIATRGTPPWDDTLDAAASACAKQGGGEVTIPTSPPRFGITLPCPEVEQGSGATSRR